MKLIATIKDQDLGLDFPAPDVYTQERQAARAIVFDRDNKIALLHATNLNYHKLPGGGIEKGEEIIEALNRETMEEIGCEIEDIQELGIIEEYRNQFALHQLSYCFTARVKGEKGTPQLEPDEIEEGFETVWLSLDEAIAVIENEKDRGHYASRFITKRDLVFLQAVKKFFS
jgi:ADP-ribose pyrophosphatase YjhB (NUDIX family)